MDVEDSKVRGKVQDLQRELSLTHADLRFVDPNIMHFTLIFLGDVEESIIERICASLRGEELMAKRIRLEGLGFFPSASRPNVIWLGVSSGAQGLVQAADRAVALLRSLGFGPDKKGFQPHMTIARVRSGRNREALATKVMELSMEPIGEVMTSSVRLKKSTLTPNGPIYETLCEALP
jgi:2'-5' RNA ligase